MTNNLSGEKFQNKNLNPSEIVAKAISLDTKSSAPLSTLVGSGIKLISPNPTSKKSSMSKSEQLNLTMNANGLLVQAIEVEGYLLKNNKDEEKVAQGVFAIKDEDKWFLARGTFSKGTEVNTVFTKLEYCQAQYDKYCTFIHKPIVWRKADLLET